MNMRRTKGELYEELKVQMGFLNTSMELYEDGNVNEAKRIATTIRILVHDTKNSKSLLSQLDEKRVCFINTASRYLEGNLMPYAGLTTIKSYGKGNIEFLPNAKAPQPDWWKPGYLQFEDWWDLIIISDRFKNKLTRKDLILSVADQDGGAHVDPELNKDYAEVSKLRSFERDIVWGNGQGFVVSPEKASVWQIGYELKKTIEYSGAISDPP